MLIEGWRSYYSHIPVKRYLVNKVKVTPFSLGCIVPDWSVKCLALCYKELKNSAVSSFYLQKRFSQEIRPEMQSISMRHQLSKRLIIFSVQEKI